MNDRAYIEAYLAAHRRLHRPQWSWGRLRTVCRCGAELFCAGTRASRADPVGDRFTGARGEEERVNLAELRERLEDLERRGYGGWEVDLLSRLRPDEIVMDEARDYRVCGVEDPELGDRDAGYVMLRFEPVPKRPD